METKGKEIDMPKGKGTYGTTRGRPPKKAVTKISSLSKKKHDADKARTNSFLKQVDDMGPAASKFLINSIINRANEAGRIEGVSKYRAKQANIEARKKRTTQRKKSVKKKGY